MRLQSGCQDCPLSGGAEESTWDVALSFSSFSTPNLVPRRPHPTASSNLWDLFQP